MDAHCQDCTAALYCDRCAPPYDVKPLAATCLLLGLFAIALVPVMTGLYPAITAPTVQVAQR